MRSGTMAFLLGIVLFSQCRGLPDPLLLSALPLLLFGFHGNPVCRLPALMAAGFFWAFFHADLVLQQELPAALEGQTVQVTGRIVSLPSVQPRRTRFQFAVDELRDSNGRSWPVPGKVRLSWYQPVPEVRPGQVWQLHVRLKQPHGFMNPGGFDYERWLFMKRIRANGYVVNHAANHYTGQDHGQWIDRVRYHLRQQLAERLPADAMLDLITALSLGDRSLLSRAHNETLIRTGTSHLLAISGLHIGLVATLSFLLMRRLWGFAGRLPLYFPSTRAATLAAMLMAMIYALLAGFSIPTQRALMMVGIILLSLLSTRRYPFSSVLAVALLAVLLLDPFAVLDAGFWLSFTAVAVIAFGMACRHGSNGLFWRWGRVQVLVAVGLVPVLLAWFQQFSLLGIAANLLAVPWISLVVVPLLLAGTLLMPLLEFPATGLLYLANQALGLLWPFLELLSAADYSVWQQAAPAGPVMLCGLVGALILVQPAGMPGRWLGILWLLPLFFPPQSRPAEDEMWMTLLDVGQGLAVVIETRNHTLVYDTGAHFSDSFNAGDAVLLPFLRQRGIRHLDRLVISHGDNDHIGGARPLLRQYPGTALLTSVPDQLPVAAANCHRGQEWQWDGIHFAMLHPHNRQALANNNQSCVLQIHAGDQSLLLTGDIELAAEQRLVKDYAAGLAADVLLVPHHGSKTSSSPAFVRSVAPHLALVAAGYRNRYRLPNQDIIKRYEEAGSTVLNTAATGAVSVRFTAAGLSVETYRQQARRFWHSDRM